MSVSAETLRLLMHHGITGAALVEIVQSIEGPPARSRNQVQVAGSDQTLAAFERFWSIMPKRSGGNPKDKAKQSFIKAVDKNGEDPNSIIAGAEAAARYYAHVDKRSTIPQVVTWLNQRRWLDDYSDPIRPDHISASKMLKDHVNDQQRSAIRDGALFLM